MNENEIKILARNNRIITLKELFEGKQEARKDLANLSFEEKIKMLVDLQRLAYGWGGRKDILIWKL
ncbi:MAG: hypothetical protein ABIH40_01385 [Candidatus Omnitrophota bacterium]